MGYIGEVVQQYREKSGLSRSELAHSICTDKYIYLIEKGERSPSTEILRLLGNRLGVDLFVYYEYLDCLDPIRVREYMMQMNAIRKNNNQVELMEVTLEAKKIPDFNTLPWKYEVVLNELSYLVLYEEQPQEGIAKIKAILDSVDRKYMDDLCIINFKLLLSICYQMVGEYAQSRYMSQRACALIEPKSCISRYAQVTVAAMINQLTLNLSLNKPDTVIEIGHRLEKYQYYMNHLENMHQTFFYLACGYYQKKNIQESQQWIIKAINFLLIFPFPNDVYFFRMNPLFNSLINLPQVTDELRDDFLKMYPLSSNVKCNKY